jgi:glycosyltransferase involved in cell wall biosynthesis
VLYWVRVDDKDSASRIRTIQDRLYVCDVPAPVFSVAHNPIVISYTYNYGWVKYLSNSPTLIYELIDHLDIFSNFPRRRLQSSHKKLLRRAAVVAGTADDLLKELKPSRRDAVLCPNGVDIDHFACFSSTGMDLPADIQAIVDQGKPIIGYYGALAEWFDFELVKYAASVMDHCNFVLIGPDYDGRQIPASGIASLSNIHWLGPKQYSELPIYLSTFDVATIPFVITDALHAVSPIKLFEYMAGGKPIVATDLAECRKYSVVLTALDREDWIKSIRHALELSHDQNYLAKVRRTAQENTWTSRARTLVNALQATP